MRVAAIPAFLLLLGVAACRVAGDPAGAVVLHFQGRSAPKTEKETLRELGLELLKSSNFNTAAHPEVLQQSVTRIQDRYRRVAAGDRLVITYDRPVTVRTVGGDVAVLEIVVGLGHPTYADALFTLDEDGRVVAHEKYSGRTAMELRQAADTPANAR